MELESKIGEAIVKLRKWCGISQEKLALETGIDRRYMSDLENGKRKVSLEMLGRVTNYFNLELEDLIDFAHSIWKLNCDTVGLSEWLRDNDFENTVILESPNYMTAISGLTEEGRLVYSYRKMVWYLMLHDGMDYDTAVEFIDYNTLGALNYMGPNALIVIQDACLFDVRYCYRIIPLPLQMYGSDRSMRGNCPLVQYVRQVMCICRALY